MARATEDLAGERLNERAALLAHHWERAGEPLLAARWHGRAANWLGGSDPESALQHWRRARDMLRDQPQSDALDRLLLTATTEVMEIGAMMAERTESPGDLYDEARELADRVGDPSLTGANMLSLAAQLKAAGVRSVTGRLIVTQAPFAKVECETKDRCDARERSDTALAG